MEVLTAHPMQSLRHVAPAAPLFLRLQGSHHHLHHPQGAGVHGPVKLVLQLEGQAELQQAGRRVQLRPGDLAVVDTAQPFEVALPGPYRQCIAALPRAPVFERAESLHRHTARSLDDDPAAAWLRELMTSMAGQTVLPVGLARWHAAMALSHMLGALGRGHAAAGTVEAPSLVARARAIVEQELGDISALALAERLGVSRRHLDAQFARQGQSFGRYLWQRRLQRAAELLRAPAAPRITEVAHACGFEDSSHFARAFRRRFGQTPGAWRRSRDAPSPPAGD
jgi:AraC family transcriptional regulator, positive regulator of tynA and feaB